MLLLFTLLSCIKEEPVIADFEYTEKTNGVVEFKNTSKNATSYEWDFGTGDNSNSVNVTYKFANNKDYFVTLNATGDGGQSSKSKTVRVNTVPTTGNCIVWSNVSDEGYITVSVSGSTVGTITKYGGNTTPSCGTDGYVTITRPQGTYNYTATSQTKKIWSGTLTFENGVCTSKKLIK